MLRKIKEIDYMIVLIVLCFAGVSTLVIYSATLSTKYTDMHINNLFMYGVFLAMMIGISFINYRFFVSYFVYVLYGIGILLLLYVMLKGENYLGATRWIKIQGQQFQPSELVKIFTVLMLARFLGRRNGEKLKLIRDIIPIFAIVAVPLYFIMKQPDLGTSIVFVAILIGMLWIGNIRLSHALIGLGVGIAGILTIVILFQTQPEILEKFFEDHQMNRIETFFDPASDPDNGWHVLNSIKAISVGELMGKGLGAGYYVQNGFVPVTYSDSIFVVIGEEFGFLGIAILLLLYFVLIFRMVHIALESTDLTGSYVVVGILSMFTLQIFENIGMHIGILPLTGISLPFISYGGSSLLTNMISLGIVLSVRIHRPKTTTS